MNKIVCLIKKHKELVVYFICGVLTTIVDFVTYYILANFLGVEENLSNVISQITAILFAFVTNKIFVFQDKKKTLKDISVQFAKFFSMRLISLLMNSGFFWLMVDVMHINDLLTKAMVSVIVVVLNYIFSKLFIFKKN